MVSERENVSFSYNNLKYVSFRKDFGIGERKVTRRHIVVIRRHLRRHFFVIRLFDHKLFFRKKEP